MLTLIIVARGCRRFDNDSSLWCRRSYRDDGWIEGRHDE